MNVSQQHSPSAAKRADNHLASLSYWSIIVAYGLAAAEGIKLTEAHLEVIDYLREDYCTHGPRQHSGQLLDVLAVRFHEQGGLRHINNLFPHGSLSQAMKIAGLPLPEHQQGFAVFSH